MEIKKVTEQMREELRKPLNPSAITKHPAKSYLSSIKAIYIVERLNDVFGIGSWTQKSKQVSCTNGMVVVHSKLIIPEYGIKLESYGGNDNGGENSKNFDLGDAYKGACTDALSKMGSFLEIGIDVFKGNPTSAPEKTKEEPKKVEQAKGQVPPMKNPPPPPAHVQQVKQQLLSPAVPLWKTVIDRLREKNITDKQWPEIKRNYIITDKDEIELFKLLNWM